MSARIAILARALRKRAAAARTRVEGLPWVGPRIAGRWDWVLALLGSLAVGLYATTAVLERVGEPAMPLDDSFIHFQFARRIAEGAPGTFTPGGEYVSGATSLLWPMLLSPFYALGLKGLSLVYAAWLLGGIAHAGAAVEAYRLARPITGGPAAVGTGLMCLTFGGFAWFAWSGMETMVLAWLLLRGARLATEQWESGEASKVDLCLTSLAAALVRPEGALVGALCALAILRRPSPLTDAPGQERWLARLGALPCILAPGIAPALHWIATGQARSTTTQVKWLVGNPYRTGPMLWRSIASHLELLWDNVLAGGHYAIVFLPEKFGVVLACAIPLAMLSAYRNRRMARGLMLLAVALSVVLTTTYLSFLWNRVRYVWPFAGAWFVLWSLAATELGTIARWLGFRSRTVQMTAVGIAIGALATKLPYAVRDLAESAHAIQRQQVDLGRWAHDNLPDDARIGVNDTGAIAYFSERETFDVVGLTTPGEATYWVAGAGSRFEHYETMSRDALPTHFIVYPGWFDLPELLGPELTRRTITDQSILGGVTKVAYEADYRTLGSAEAPVRVVSPGELIDRLDVADLESEAAHQYELGWTFETQNRCDSAFDSEGKRVADGGRFERRHDRFVLKAPEAGAPGRLWLVARIDMPAESELVLSVDGAEVETRAVPSGSFQEIAFELPRELSGRIAVELTATGELGFGSLHYWLYATTP